MSTEMDNEKLKAFEEDPRKACQYGENCYQKNAAHHDKYKHPPKKTQEATDKKTEVVTGKKRSSSECDEESSTAERKTKILKESKNTSNDGAHSLSPSPDREILDSEMDDEKSEKAEIPEEVTETKCSPTKNSISPVKDKEMIESEAGETAETVLTGPEKTISDLFLVKMPKDFYKFYDFCKSLLPRNPSAALKILDLQLVGPFDVLSNKIDGNSEIDPEKCLRYWRYYYDPPEFQTILRGNDKEGLHYGYWRDVIEEPPNFVAKNSANTDCTIVPVAPNIFAAVHKHLEEKSKKANPFEKGPIVKLSKQLKKFAKENGIGLESQNVQMRSRDRKVVTKTLHGAGIVVPYDKKTQVGYRDLSATDSQLKRMLKAIDEAESDDERRKCMVKLEEVARWATIAADECDFGTCLELGHDLFSSGVVHVQRMGLRMLTSAYKLLNRRSFAKIAEAHAKDRKKGCELGDL